MMGMCKLAVIGNVGSVPEQKFTKNGKPMCSFSVACNWKDMDGEEKTDWYRVTAWNRLAELCGEHLHKGSRVYVEGRLTHRAYETRDGKAGVSYDVAANEVIALDRREQGEAAQDGEGIPF